jgi:muramoyltetrapeptide carboxypeptidase
MQGKQIPQPLIPGDKIAIVATARKISREELQPAIDMFGGYGLTVVADDLLFSSHNQFAGTDEVRASMLQQYIDDDSVKAIISARGGYGTVRIIDQIDFSRLIKHPKWVIGYSDITVLHSHMFTHTGIATLHATMPVNMQQHNINKQSVEALMKVLMSDKPLHYQVPAQPLNREGEATGELVGGNLSVLFSLLGSASDLDTSGKILFLEDLDEYLYHIDRMMQALNRAGKLANIKGLIVGGMSEMRDNQVPYGYNASEIIAQHARQYDFPVAFGFPAGHEPVNLPLIMGAKYRMLVNKDGLSFSSIQ